MWIDFKANSPIKAVIKVNYIQLLNGKIDFKSNYFLLFSHCATFIWFVSSMFAQRSSSFKFTFYPHIPEKKTFDNIIYQKILKETLLLLIPKNFAIFPHFPHISFNTSEMLMSPTVHDRKKKFTPRADFHLCIFKPKAIWFEKSFLGTWSNAMLYNFSSYLVAFSVDGTCVLNWIIHRISKVGEIYTYFRDFVWDRQNCDTFLRQNCNTFLSGWRNLSRNRNQLSKLYSPFYRFKYRRSVWKSIFSGGEVSEEIKPYVVGKKSKT